MQMTFFYKKKHCFKENYLLKGKKLFTKELN